jgi:hypothetical protein
MRVASSSDDISSEKKPTLPLGCSRWPLIERAVVEQQCTEQTLLDLDVAGKRVVVIDVIESRAHAAQLGWCAPSP